MRNAHLRLLVLAIPFLLSAAATQAQQATEGEKLLGTWVDTTAMQYYAKVEIVSDTKMFRYMKGHLDQPYSEARYTIDKTWSDDEGNYFCQCTVRWSWVPFNDSSVYSKIFVLFGVDALGNTLKINQSNKEWPIDFHSGVISRYTREEKDTSD